MDNSINITRAARDIAERAIPKPKTIEDKAALRLIECALSITLSRVVGSRAEVERLLKLAENPFDLTAAESYRQFDYKDQGVILHRVRKAVKGLS